jgi:hypothetical protein
VLFTFSDPGAFTGPHYDQSKIGGKRSVVSVDRVQREFVCRRQFQYFCARGFQFPAQSFLLALRLAEIRCAQKSQVAPSRGSLRLIPTSDLWRAHDDPSQGINHRMAVEASFRPRRRHVCNEFSVAARHARNLNW